MKTSTLTILSMLSLPLLKRASGSGNEFIMPPVPEILQKRYKHITEDSLSARQKECYDNGFKGVMPLPVFLDLWRLNPRLVNLEILEKEYEMTGTVELNTAIIPYTPWYPADIRAMFTRLYDSPRTSSHVVEFEIPENIPILEGINCFFLDDPNKFEYYRDIVFPCFDASKINMPSGIWVFEYDLEALSDFIKNLTGIYFLSVSVVGPRNRLDKTTMPMSFLSALSNLQNIDFMKSFIFDYYTWSGGLLEGEYEHYDLELWKLLNGRGSKLLSSDFRRFPSREVIASVSTFWKNKTLLPWILSKKPFFITEKTSELRRF